VRLQVHDEQFAGQSKDTSHDDLSQGKNTTKITLIRMPDSLKVTGRTIMEPPIMVLARAAPVMKADLPI